MYSIAYNNFQSICDAAKNKFNMATVAALSLPEIILGAGIRSSEPLSVSGNSSYNVYDYKSISVDVPSSAATLTAAQLARSRTSYVAPMSSFISDATSIGPGTFAECSGVTGVDSNDIVSIGDYAFYNCKSWFVSVNAPNTSYIGDYAFYGCTSLSYVNAPNAEYIGDYAFSRCSALSVVNIANAKTIGKYAFYGCGSLQSLVDGIEHVERIEFSAFDGCGKLAMSLSMPEVKYIGSSAFTYCVSLTDVYAPKLEYLGSSAFGMCSGLTSVYFPKLKKIDYGALVGCSGITELIIPEVEYIGPNAIGCNITELWLYNVKTIGQRGIGGWNSSLKSVYLLMSYIVPLKAYGYPFTNFATSFKIYVPESLLSAYLSANIWSEYTSSRIKAYTGS
jgi:hypothetical protein